MGRQHDKWADPNKQHHHQSIFNFNMKYSNSQHIQLKFFKVTVIYVQHFQRYKIFSLHSSTVTKSLHSSTVTKVLSSGRCRGQELSDLDPGRCRGQGHSIFTFMRRMAVLLIIANEYLNVKKQTAVP